MAVIGAGPALGDGVMKHSGLSGAPIKQDPVIVAGELRSVVVSKRRVTSRLL